MTYAFSENFILPLSHDEVVHGKCSLIEKMPGNYDDKFNNLRVLLCLSDGAPGQEAQLHGQANLRSSSNGTSSRDSTGCCLVMRSTRRCSDFVKTLNRFYLEHRELWENDSDWDGLSSGLSRTTGTTRVIAFRRIRPEADGELVVVCNFCPVLRENYRLGLPKAGWYESGAQHRRRGILGRHTGLEPATVHAPIERLRRSRGGHCGRVPHPAGSSAV